jgi:RNA polymerase-binding transcription factor DksA
MTLLWYDKNMDTSQTLQKLETLRATVVAELETLAVYHSTTDDWEARFDFASESDPDSNVAGDTSEAAEETIATLALLETHYRNIMRAIAKVHDGTYGICEISGETIEPERLSVDPAARTCIRHRENEIDLPL